VIDLSTYQRIAETASATRLRGRVTEVVGLSVEASGPSVSLGELCRIRRSDGSEVAAEVAGFRDDRVILMPLGDTLGVYPGAEVIATGGCLRIGVGDGLLGRVLGALGQPIDGRGPVAIDEVRNLSNDPPPPLSRELIRRPLATGIRAVDGLLTLGCGQRIGIFAGSGVGKSTLLGMVARNTEADVNVIGLIGERGREVREFIEKDLGREGLARSVVIAATSDRCALERVKGAMAAVAVAEYFRDRGRDVMLMMDSVTRFAMAQREIGLAVGEPPATRGYTPSVFALLPRLLERAGTSPDGSITGLYTVLVEADDMNEPVADAMRAILDGHIVLSRDLASRGHYPSIDILQSISRVMPDVVPKAQLHAASELRDLVATHRNAEDLINIGAYVHGSSPKIDRAVRRIDAINDFLKQRVEETVPYSAICQALTELAEHEAVSV